MPDLIFMRCARGYLFREDTSGSGMIAAMWAFSTYDEACDWLRERERQHLDRSDMQDTSHDR